MCVDLEHIKKRACVNQLGDKMNSKIAKTLFMLCLLVPLTLGVSALSAEKSSNQISEEITAQPLGPPSSDFDIFWTYYDSSGAEVGWRYQTCAGTTGSVGTITNICFYEKHACEGRYMEAGPCS